MEKQATLSNEECNLKMLALLWSTHLGHKIAERDAKIMLGILQAARSIQSHVDTPMDAEDRQATNGISNETLNALHESERDVGHVKPYPKNLSDVVNKCLEIDMEYGGRERMIAKVILKSGVECEIAFNKLGNMFNELGHLLDNMKFS